MLEQRAKQKTIVTYSLWVLGVWLLLVLAYAARMFIVSRGSGPTPELGYNASFIFFVVCYSIPYFVLAFGIYGLAVLSSTADRKDDT
jgi:hypothetical protein